MAHDQDSGEALNELINIARNIQMTVEQEREQRISFVYGNTNIENGRITRELVEAVEDRISKK